MIQAKNVHIIGLGGIGTSAVARLFLEQGAKVSGSDMHVNSIIEDLKREGVDFRLGHFAENIPRECDLVIYSRAIPATCVERQVASEQGITEMSYPEFLGEIAKTKKTIAVSGTNGKSTTTAMIASDCWHSSSGLAKT
ncbi:MAG: UDP-N-acetylmuramate-alanine ligase [Candidatus Uhrbacteria bacterium GW2011_GWF2_41_430]|nr:MAG: UDP-N-acetylmuramate-alanine ligase [Candidatus Uhrbacteria bacterium GW2011_GWF2_41_430]